jgi:DNA-binding NarL/FixJ family response regulator
MEPIRILLVEDQSITRVALHTIIDARPDMKIIAETGLGAEAVQLHRTHKPDVTIMDLRLPGMSGFDAIAAIHRESPAARILVLTNYEGSEDVHRAIQLGASGYLLKETSKEELLHAIVMVHQGKRYLATNAGALLAECMSGSNLTDRELDVLALLCKGCNNRAVADALAISENTARIHVSRILQKLGVEDRTQAVIAAIRSGLIHVE